MPATGRRRAYHRGGFASGLAVWILLSACGAEQASQLPKPTPVRTESATVSAPLPAETVATGCTQVSIHCGETPTLAFDRSGRLWAAFAQDGHVYVTLSADLGASFSEPVRVHDEVEKIETNGENRPKIAFGRSSPDDTSIFVSWTKKVDGMFKGDIRFTRSLDGGRSFEPIRTVNDDGIQTGHRFESLHVDAAGDVYLTWIDKRDREAARERGEAYKGAAIYYAVSTDRGATFLPNRRISDSACECCRIATADDPNGGVTVLWRHIFDTNTRDHAIASLGAEGISEQLQRITFEGWQIDACPHHGPSMVPAGEDGFHLAWFTAANDEPTLYYGRFDSPGGGLRHETAMATEVPQAHPHLVTAGRRLVLVWKGADDDDTHIYLKESDDDGESWSTEQVVASTRGASDHPFLLARDGKAYLSWHTAAEGLRIIELSQIRGAADSRAAA